MQHIHEVTMGTNDEDNTNDDATFMELGLSAHVILDTYIAHATHKC